MINKEKFYTEVTNLNVKDITKFDLLYEIASGNRKDDINKINLTDDILESLFRVPVYPDVLIPLKFWDSEIGKAILILRYSFENIYLVCDLVKLTGTTDKNIRKAATRGTLKGEKRGSTWIFYEKDVKQYLNNKKSNIKYASDEEQIITDDIKESEYHCK